MFKFLLLALFIIPSVSQAKRIDADWPLRVDYERLVACEVLDKPFYGQRTWETQKIAEQVMAIDLSIKPGRCSSEQTELILDRLMTWAQKQYRSDDSQVKLNPIERVKGSYDYISGGDSLYTANGRGSINATINTFRENQNGRLLGVGHQLSIQTDHALLYKKQYAFVRPQFDVLFKGDLSEVDDYRITVDQAYLHLEGFNIGLDMGRLPVIWGQGEYGGLLFSQNSRSLDHMQLYNVDPFRMPWIFKHLGEWKFSFLFGNLGPKQFFKYTWFTGGSIGVKPTKFLEFNISHALQFGGQGAPNMTFGTGVQEFFGFIPFVAQTGKIGGNKLTELNMRFFAPWMGMQGYFTYFMDDANTGSGRAIKKHFLYNSSYQAGLYFLCFLNSCKDSLRVEYTNSTHIAYRSGTFLNGWTQNQNIIGHNLGPDGQGIFLSWDRQWTNDYNHRFQVQYFSREQKSYIVSPDGLTVTTVTNGPAEKRLSLYSGHELKWKESLFNLGVGYEHIQDYRFVGGQSKNVGVVRLSYAYHFE